MQASVGDRLLVHGRIVGQHDRTAEIVEVLGDINARYLLGYISSNQANDGRWRKLEVRLTRPDLKSARIRARKGYFGG